MFPPLQHDARPVMTHTSANQHPLPSLPPSALYIYCASPLEALSNLSGLAHAWIKMPLSPPLSLPSHAASRQSRLCQRALRYLMVAPTCHHCDI